MYVICVIWNLAKFYKGDAGTQSATLLTTKEEISTVLAEKLGSGGRRKVPTKTCIHLLL